MPKEKIQLFNDGSKAFKLLYNELKEVKDLIVKDVQDYKEYNKDDYLLQLFTKVDTNIKTYLHYTADDLKDNKEQKRRAIEKVERMGFKNKIVLPYEGMDNRTVDQRYDKFNLDAVDIPIKVDDDKPYESVPEPVIIKDNKVKIDDNIYDNVKKYNTKKKKFYKF